jgi:hypothetical protein
MRAQVIIGVRSRPVQMEHSVFPMAGAQRLADVRRVRRACLPRPRMAGIS